MIHKFLDSNKFLVVIFMTISIMLLSDSCTTSRRGVYNKKRTNSTMSYNIRNRSHYKAKRNRQPIAKNYSIRNTRSNGKY